MISEELRPVRDISWEVKKIFSKIFFFFFGGGGGELMEVPRKKSKILLITPPPLTIRDRRVGVLHTGGNLVNS